MHLRRCVWIWPHATLARNPQTMRGMLSAATLDSSMPRESKFAATIFHLDRNRNTRSCTTHPRLCQCVSRKLQGMRLRRCVWICLHATLARNPRTMRGMLSAATLDSSMPRESKFAATISHLDRNRNTRSCTTHPRLCQCVSRKLQGMRLRRCVWICLHATLARNPQTMHGMLSTATLDSSMPQEDKFASIISHPVCLRTMNAKSIMPPDPPVNPPPNSTNDARNPFCHS
jgi:hypothetical protein